MAAKRDLEARTPSTRSPLLFYSDGRAGKRSAPAAQSWAEAAVPALCFPLCPSTATSGPASAVWFCFCSPCPGIPWPFPATPSSSALRGHLSSPWLWLKFVRQLAHLPLTLRLCPASLFHQFQWPVLASCPADSSSLSPEPTALVEDIQSLFAPVKPLSVQTQPSDCNPTYSESPQAPKVAAPIVAGGLQALLQAAPDGGQATDPRPHNSTHWAMVPCVGKCGRAFPFPRVEAPPHRVCSSTAEKWFLSPRGLAPVEGSVAGLQ